MVNFTSNTYQMKWEILSFSNKISKHLSKPDKKFSADMTYGMLASGSCLLTDVVDQLHEDTKKVNSVARQTRHLNNGTSSTALKSYLTTFRSWAPQQPVIHIDDSYVVKPDGYKFEALGLVREQASLTALTTCSFAPPTSASTTSKDVFSSAAAVTKDVRKTGILQYSRLFHFGNIAFTKPNDKITRIVNAFLISCIIN